MRALNSYPVSDLCHKPLVMFVLRRSLSHDLFVSVGEEGALVGWDMRAHTDRPVLTRTGLHRGAIHAVDFSPSQPYTLATGAFFSQ